MYKRVKISFSYKADFGIIKGEMQMVVDSEEEKIAEEANKFIRSVSTAELFKFEIDNPSELEIKLTCTNCGEKQTRLDEIFYSQGLRVCGGCKKENEASDKKSFDSDMNLRKH